MSEEEKLPNKSDFSEWYHQLVRRILIDQRYPLQGFLVYRPYGYEIFERYIRILEEMLSKTGHKKTYFPTLIPYRLLAKESEHIRGYESQVFWVTHGGLEKMEEKAALRPTSETAMYEMLRYWIRSWRNLPIKIHQSCSVFRYETGHTRPLIRDREILWNEAHTSHATLKDAKKQIREAVKIYSKFFDRLCLPYVWIDVVEGIFAGAISAYELYTVFPNGRVLEMGSVNNLGQKFSKVFDIKYKTKEGEDEYVWQTSYGVSERILAALVAVHGDDRGMILPPELAPIQVVIVPIVYENTRDEVIAFSKKLAGRLKSFRVYLDERDDVTPGEKFYEWEMHGVPLRIEIGKRDIDNGGITIARRDTGEKKFVKDSELKKEIKLLLKDIEKNLREKAKKYHSEKIVDVENIDEIKKAVEDKKLSRVNWCGSLKCASEIEKKADVVFIGKGLKEKGEGACIVCGKKAKYKGYAGKTY